LFCSLLSCLSLLFGSPRKDYNEVSCKCKLNLDVDEHSFFWVCGIGQKNHNGHFPWNTLPEDVRSHIQVMLQSGVGYGAVARLIRRTTGLHVTRRTIKRNAATARLLEDVTGCSRTQEDIGKIDIDIITEHLKKNNMLYTALYHRKESVAEDSLYVETGAAGSEPVRVLVTGTGAGGQNEKVMEYATETRQDVAAGDEQDVLVALVWMSPEQLQLFQAFPEFFSVDGTHKTQREGWELVTMAIINQACNPSVVMKCWAPNNRQWFFKWLFQVAV